MHIAQKKELDIRKTKQKWDQKYDRKQIHWF